MASAEAWKFEYYFQFVQLDIHNPRTNVDMQLASQYNLY